MGVENICVFRNKIKERMKNGRSLINRRNSKGPKFDPCGTPCFAEVEYGLSRPDSHRRRLLVKGTGARISFP